MIHIHEVPGSNPGVCTIDISLESMPKVIDQHTIIGDVLHTWTAPEYETHNRSRAWYALMSIVALLLLGYAVFSGNFLFALVIILAAIILFLQGKQEPLKVTIGITEFGIVISNRFYTYSELETFYIVYNPPFVKTLFFETKSPARPKLRIPLLEQNPVEIRDTLVPYLKEDIEKEEEPFADMIARQWMLH